MTRRRKQLRYRSVAEIMEKREDKTALTHMATHEEMLKDVEATERTALGCREDFGREDRLAAYVRQLLARITELEHCTIVTALAAWREKGT